MSSIITTQDRVKVNIVMSINPNRFHKTEPEDFLRKRIKNSWILKKLNCLFSIKQNSSGSYNIEILYDFAFKENEKDSIKRMILELKQMTLGYLGHSNNWFYEDKIIRNNLS